MKVDGSLKSLIQGVSQQPERSRLPGQCTEQVNMSSNPVEGLSRRPPLDWIKELFSSAETDTQFYEFTQGTERFIMCALEDEIRVFDLEGNEKVVTEEGDAFDYLGGGELVFTTLDDKTYVANKSVVCKMQEDVFADFLDYGSIVYVRGGNYARDYTIKIQFKNEAGADTEISVTHTTPNGSSVSHGTEIATTFIATKLYDALLAQGTPTAFNGFLTTANTQLDNYQGIWLAATTCNPSLPACIAANTNLSNYRASLLSALNSMKTNMPIAHAPTTAAIDAIIALATSTAEITNTHETTFDTAMADYMTFLNATNFSGIFTATRVDDLIHITWLDPNKTDPIRVRVEDGVGGNNMVGVNNQVGTTATLPRYAPQNYHVAVTGDGNASADDWYLVFSISPDSDGNVPATGEGFGKPGVWVETVKSRTEYLLDSSTMPHVLQYDEDTDEFTFYVGDWKGRQVGDENSNENPSFVNRTIEDMSYFQQRLVVLSGPAVIMSRPNKPFDFWIESATARSQSDAIDVESTAKGVTKMLKVIPQNRDLVIFADGAAQFIIFGRNNITPDNCALVLTTSFESNLTAKPVPAGRNLFFAINYGQYTGIREFYTEGSEDINDSRPITQHVLKYIKGHVRAMASSSNFDTLLVQAENRKFLYLYEYIWVDDQKVQSSWSRWELPDDVHHFFFVESVIYIISKMADTYVLQKIDLNVQDDAGLNYQVRLDKKLTIHNVNDNIVYPDIFMPPVDEMYFVQGEGCPNPGQQVLATWNGTSFDLYRDMEGGSVICGRKYTSYYIPTLPMVKDQDGVKIGTGTLIISKFFLNVRRSGVIKAIVSGRYRDAVSLLFTGRFVSDSETQVGEQPIVDKSYTIPFRENIENGDLEITSDHFTPFTLMDIEWIGQYRKRGRRITQGS